MPIYTSYLSFVTKYDFEIAKKLRTYTIYYIARNRGNNYVAPTHDMLDRYKGSKDWESYEKEYLERLKDPIAIIWMQGRAEETIKENIVLVCFERDAQFCHRRLLAEQIARRCKLLLGYNDAYKGELTDYFLLHPE